MTPVLRHAPTGAVLAERVRRARTVRERLRGAIGREPNPGDALVIPTAQVHTFFMRADIDVLFCDRDWRVIHVVHRMRPWRVTRWVRAARHVIELPGGAADIVRPGDELSLV